MTWKFTRAQTFGALGIAVLLFLPSVPSSVSSDLVLEPGKDAHLRTQVAGKVAQVFIHEGQEVKARTAARRSSEPRNRIGCAG